MYKGSIYWDESSKGIRNGEQRKQSRWVAERIVKGRRIRMRSANYERCLAWLEGRPLPPQTPNPRVELIVVSPNSTLLMDRHNDCYTMEQRRAMICQRIEECELTLEYFRTLDFSPIHRHIEQVVMPRISYRIDRLRLRRQAEHVVFSALAVMYMKLSCGVPICNYEYYIVKLLKEYKKRGSFGYREIIPRDLLHEVEQVDLSRLSQRYVVKKLK